MFQDIEIRADEYAELQALLAEFDYIGDDEVDAMADDLGLEDEFSMLDDDWLPF